MWMHGNCILKTVRFMTRKLIKLSRGVYESWYPYESLMPSKDSLLTKWYGYLENKLPRNEVHEFRKQLFAHRVCFIPFYSPACNVINLPFSYNHIISVDIELMNKIYNGNEELIFPVILHEIGHIFNVPNEDFGSTSSFKELQDEFYADDYVRMMGFETELLNSLEHYEKWKKDNNLQLDKVFESRIKRLKDVNSPYNEKKKGINIKTYNKKKLLYEKKQQGN